MSPNEMALHYQDTHLSSTIISNRNIANYKLVELRGSGGMANIFKAIQLSLERPVALKIMHPHLVSNEAFVARFEKEAKRAAMLQHENIVAIIDYGCDNGEYYIAMEYIAGTNLGEMLKKQKKMPLEICLHICHQVAEGLKYAHSQGIVHRDIKPANIMLSYDGRVMLTDFGIAKADGDLSITSTGQVIGSPSYMSPEQAAGKSLDHRSDLFSLGIILYEIIAGEKPFKGDTYQSLIASIMSDTPVPLGQTRIDVTTEINLLVLKALEKSADSRYQSAEDFSEAIAAQLNKFKISSSRKMMSDYLKSPIRVTERLRTDKITDHMESGLYFLAVGEGKLAEARREFQEVLRFDRRNKEAKKYLSRLESHPAIHQADDNSTTFHLGPAARAILVSLGLLIFAGSILFLSGRKEKPISEEPINRTGEIRVDTPGPDVKPSDADRAAEKSAGKPAEQVSLPIEKIPPVKTPEKALAKTDDRSYNYPDQDLARFGSVNLTTKVPARLWIDGRDYGWTGGPAIKLTPGRHLVEVEAKGYRKVSKRIFIKRGETDSVNIDLVP